MRKLFIAALAALSLAAPATASAFTSSVTTSTGYTVTLSGPDTAAVGVPATYTATCGGAPCPYGNFRMFGGYINRLGEGFGVGATGRYTFRAPGFFTARYMVGASCPGSPNRACPIYVYGSTAVS